MNDIKIGQLYKHTPTGIIRRVVDVDKNYVTLEGGDCGYSRFGNIENFKKFWKPYKEDNKTSDDKVNHPSHYTWLKNIIGKLFQHISTGEIRKVVYANDDWVTLSDNNMYSQQCSIKDFSKFWKPCGVSNTYNTSNVSDDKVKHPSHYTWLKDLCGIEVIDITRYMDFNLGNSIKYILRSGHKKEEGYTDKQKTVEDLKKAIWYIEDEIKMLENKK